MYLNYLSAVYCLLWTISRVWKTFLLADKMTTEFCYESKSILTCIKSMILVLTSYFSSWSVLSWPTTRPKVLKVPTLVLESAQAAAGGVLGPPPHRRMGCRTGVHLLKNRYFNFIRCLEIVTLWNMNYKRNYNKLIQTNTNNTTTYTFEEFKKVDSYNMHFLSLLYYFLLYYTKDFFF